MLISCIYVFKEPVQIYLHCHRLLKDMIYSLIYLYNNKKLCYNNKMMLSYYTISYIEQICYIKRTGDENTVIYYAIYVNLL